MTRIIHWFIGISLGLGLVLVVYTIAKLEREQYGQSRFDQGAEEQKARCQNAHGDLLKNSTPPQEKIDIELARRKYERWNKAQSIPSK